MDVSIPKGTRDFLPVEVIRRKWMFRKIEEVFTTFGYVPIETPVLENLSTLTGKYGEEGDRLLFKVLNNGEFLDKSDEAAFQEKDHNRFATSIAKRGLRYDLTVPFARYVVMHRNEITLPFKRYQIQPVWRADRPQKGRYQEFYQCDVDVVGSKSLTYEIELVRIYDAVFAALGIPVTIRINHRQLLFRLASNLGIGDHWIQMTMAIDKLDKVGEMGVRKEMSEKSIPENVQDEIFSLLTLNNLNAIKDRFSDDEEMQECVRQLGFVLDNSGTLSSGNVLSFDMTLARGLGYYTGCIFEVTGNGVAMGSLGGGGRYDNLTGVFGWQDVPGVGISFGAERIYDVMQSANLFPESIVAGPKIILAVMDQESFPFAIDMISKIRQAGIPSDLYPEAGKLKKPLKYADDIGAAYAGIIGEQEREQGMIMVKDIRNGQQELLSIEQIISKLS